MKRRYEGRWIIVLYLLLFPLVMEAQPISGTTGLLNIPSAAMQEDGTFFMGTNFLPKEITPSTFSYPTANYFFNITFLPFCEVNYRCTLFKTASTGKYDQQDRSYALRLRLLKEKKFLPAIVIGGNDLYTHVDGNSNQYFGSAYIVSSKTFSNKIIGIQPTVGYGFAKKMFRNSTHDGIFGGLTLWIPKIQSIKLLAEYDTKAFNAGASILLFKHLFLYSFAYDLKHLCGGVQYKVYLKTD